MKQTFEYCGLESLPKLASDLLVLARESSVWTFQGEMGTGKTTLIKEICKQLKVVDEVQSPTYSLVNEYQTASKQAVYHFDLFRLNDLGEILDIGFHEYLDSGSLCLIEWPEAIFETLDLPFAQIKIEANDVTCRILQLQLNGLS